MIITSTKNQFVKQARLLCQKKYRTELGLFLIEGINLIKDMPCNVKIEGIFTTVERQQEAEDIIAKKALESAQNGAQNADCVGNAPLYVVSDDVMQYIADTVSPYGIVAVCKIPNMEFAFPRGNALLLDAVQDPGNLGTIFRTAAACDFLDVYLLDCADLYSPKVVRATLGGLFKVRAYQVDENSALSLIENSNSIVLDMGGENILKSEIEKPTLLIAGNEAHGVRDSIKSKAKKVYSLPMQNQIESLNVAVATSVAMYCTI